MEKKTKYKFTSEQKMELNSLREHFDNLFELFSPKGGKLYERMNKYEELTKREHNLMIRELDRFNKEMLKGKFRDLFIYMTKLIELESNYQKQEVINELLENENYERLELMRKMGHLKYFDV